MHDVAAPSSGLFLYPQIADAEEAAALPVQIIAASPRLRTALAWLSSSLRDIYRLNPRMGRTLASHQRWMMTQAAFALHMEYDPSNKASGLTVGRLRDMVTTTSAASRNTVLNFMEELRHYRLVRDAPQPEGARSRRRRMEVTEPAEEAMARWFRINLGVLDQLDGGTRVAMNDAEPGIFGLAQPMMARACVSDSRWLNPPASVGLFQWTEGGALAMDDLVTRCAAIEPDEAGLYRIGPIQIRQMAEEFMMSHTHLQRLFRKAAELGVIGWEGPRRKADLWVAQSFLDDYKGWQAVKLSHLDHAFHRALHRLGRHDPA